MKKKLLLMIVFAMAISVNAQTIYQIQGQGSASPYADATITTTGIVTAIREGGEPVSTFGFFIQDGTGQWNGIYVYNEELSQNIAVGDEVTVSGTCVEYYTMTEITDCSAITINSSGNSLPAASVLSTGSVGTEAYEGVLVKVSNAECTAGIDTHGIWTINDGSGNTYVDDWMFHLYPDATVGSHYDVTGCLIYDFDQFKICPRNENDVTLLTAINEIETNIYVYPNPATTTLNISETSNIVIYSITGQEIMNKTNTNSVNVANLKSGIYFAQLQTQQGTTIKKFVVE